MSPTITFEKTAPNDEKVADVKKKSSLHDDVVIQEEQVGVYRLFIGHSKRVNLLKQFNEWKDALPLLQRLFTDIYAIAPSLFVLYIASLLWSGIEEAVMMHLSSNLLRVIEVGVLNGKPFVGAVIRALISRGLFGLLGSYLTWWREELERRLRVKVETHFELHLMKVNLRLDIPTSLNATSKVNASASSAWTGFSEVAYFLISIVTAFSQLFVIYNAAKASRSPTFVLVCLAKPFFRYFFTRSVWDKVCYAYINNVHHLRMKALESLSTGSYREDVLSGNLSSWIIKEYEESQEKVGDLTDEYPLWVYSKHKTPLYDMISGLLDDLPMVFCGLSAILNPTRFSIASIAIFQSSSSTLQWTITSIFGSSEQFKKNIADVKNLYQAHSINNTLVDGRLPYPECEKASDAGMAFQLRDLSFSYPGSKKTSSALKSLNVTVPAGSLVVIVGGNGSGKSTLIRILSRLFDPTSGDLLVDGRPVQDYRMADLRQATALLSQENVLYPLTFAENIGLGCVDLMSNRELIKDAAAKGGAAEFISKLETGFDTVLDPMLYTVSVNLHGNEDHPLHEKMQTLEKKINISGGERQRIVAARSFMRLNSGTVKFIAVDEPSSALDAEGELQLFNNLLAARGGKTVIFVTHRFGHLTKRADMILCMKDGEIAETGTHDQLLAQGGEYAKLYNIQANAFSDGPASCSDQQTSLTASK